MKYAIILIIGVFLGWWFTKINTDKEVQIEAKKRYYQTEEGKKEKIQVSLDSITRASINEEVNKSIVINNMLMELVSKYKDLSSEEMAKGIIEVTSKMNSHE